MAFGLAVVAAISTSWVCLTQANPLPDALAEPEAFERPQFWGVAAEQSDALAKRQPFERPQFWGVAAEQSDALAKRQPFERPQFWGVAAEHSDALAKREPFERPQFWGVAAEQSDALAKREPEAEAEAFERPQFWGVAAEQSDALAKREPEAEAEAFERPQFWGVAAEHSDALAKREPFERPQFWGVAAEQSDALAKRGPDDWVIQDCAVGGKYTGPFRDGEGVYVTSDDVRTEHRPKNDGGEVTAKCWNDYYAVSYESGNSPWVPLDGWGYGEWVGFTLGKSKQSCDTRTVTLSMDVSMKAWGKLALIPGKVFGLGGSVSIANAHQDCASVDKSKSCTNRGVQGDPTHNKSAEEGADKTYVRMWIQRLRTRQIGYKRKRCDDHDGKGDYTDCISPWEQSRYGKFENFACSTTNSTHYCSPDGTCSDPNIEWDLAAMEAYADDLKGYFAVYDDNTKPGS